LRRLPQLAQREALRRSLVPGASLWLRDRAKDMPIITGRRITSVARANGHLRLGLDDTTWREVDHVVLATGYRPDVRRYGFLSPSVIAALRCVEGHPVLGDGLESSVAGLHFLGAPAALSFGPLLRFVSGTEFAARALVRSITRLRAGTADRERHDATLEYRSTERRA
jgi:hypothetical protein